MLNRFAPYFAHFRDAPDAPNCLTKALFCPMLGIKFVQLCGLKFNDMLHATQSALSLVEPV